MSASRRNLVWPVLIIGIGITLLLISASVIPEAIEDLLIRSWPVLLVIFGLNILLVDRVQYANWIVFGFALILVVVIANMAYARQTDEYRSDYTARWSGPLAEEVEYLIVRIEIKETRATISPYIPDLQIADEQLASRQPRWLEASFEGSTESTVDIDVDHTPGSAEAVLTIRESGSGILPRLDEMGRGTLNVFLPPGIAIREIQYEGEDGSLTVDLRGITVDTGNLRLDFLLQRGNMKMYLPQTGNILGDGIQIDNGYLDMVVLETRSLRLNLTENTELVITPESYRNRYLALQNNIYQTEGVTGNNFEIVLDIAVQDEFTLQHVSPETGN